MGFKKVKFEKDDHMNVTVRYHMETRQSILPLSYLEIPTTYNVKIFGNFLVFYIQTPLEVLSSVFFICLPWHVILNTVIKRVVHGL